MESFSLLESTRPNIILIGIFVAFVLSWLVLSGLWMKLANKLCGGTPVGMLRATFAVVVSTVICCCASAIAVYMAPNDPPYVSAMYGTLGSVLGISLVLFQNPLRAFLTYIVCSVLQVVSAIGFVIAFLLVATLVIPKERFEEIGAELEQLARQHRVVPEAQSQHWPESDDPMFETETTSVKNSGIAMPNRSAATSFRSINKLPLADGVQANPFAQ